MWWQYKYIQLLHLLRVLRLLARATKSGYNNYHQATKFPSKPPSPFFVPDKDPCASHVREHRSSPS